MHSDTALMQSMPFYLRQAASLFTAMWALPSACMLFSQVLTGLQFHSYQSSATIGSNHASMLSMQARLHNRERKSIVTKLRWGGCCTLHASSSCPPRSWCRLATNRKHCDIMPSCHCPRSCTSVHGAALSIHILQQQKQESIVTKLWFVKAGVGWLCTRYALHVCAAC